MKKKYNKWEECLILKEVKALIGLRNANIVTLNELIMTNSGELFLVFEFAGLNLYEWSKQVKEIPENKIRNIIFQILQGLSYMHKQNFFHRDMKPENILVTEKEDIVKIADFG
jgi:serine/threonine protein kinase